MLFLNLSTSHVYPKVIPFIIWYLTAFTFLKYWPNANTYRNPNFTEVAKELSRTFLERSGAYSIKFN